MPRLLVRLSPGFQVAGKRLTLTGNGKKLADIDRQRTRETFKNGDAWIEFSPFEAADIGTVDLRIDSQVLLGDAPFGPYPTKIPCDARACVHGADAINLSHLKPSNIFNIIRSALRKPAERT